MGHGTKAPGLAPGKVRMTIAGMVLAGPVSIDSLATRLGTSPRTLQRRLKQRGTTFWTLVAQCRFEIASALLRDTDLPVQAIARQVGYSTPGAFARAFANWAGQSPRAFRVEAAGPRPPSADWREMGRTASGHRLPSIDDPDPSEET
jgi:AraC-like DNA-binding protein